MIVIKRQSPTGAISSESNIGNVLARVQKNKAHGKGHSSTAAQKYECEIYLLSRAPLSKHMVNCYQNLEYPNNFLKTILQKRTRSNFTLISYFKYDNDVNSPKFLLKKSLLLQYYTTLKFRFVTMLLQADIQNQNLSLPPLRAKVSAEAHVMIVKNLT